MKAQELKPGARLPVLVDPLDPARVVVDPQATGLSLPAASKLVRDLVEHGLLERSEDPADRRRTVVALSPRSARRVPISCACKRSRAPW